MAKLGETPSAATHASARSLARLGAFMANKGSLDGKTIINEDLWSQLHSEHRTLTEAYLFTGQRTTYTKGGFHLFGTDHFTNHEEGITSTPYDFPERGDKREEAFHNLRPGHFGWQGYGGSVFTWHPDLKISVAYVPTDLMMLDIPNLRGGKIQKLVTDIVKRIKNLA